MTINRYILGLGSNLGDRFSRLREAHDKLEENGMSILRASSNYETEPWGILNQPLFINQIIEVATVLSPRQLLDIIHKIESLMGRIRNYKYEARAIDIDILFYENYQLKSNALTLPHPEISKRKFVLVPLSEIYPNLIHPVYRKTILQLLEECKDSCSVIKIEENAAIPE